MKPFVRACLLGFLSGLVASAATNPSPPEPASPTAAARKFAMVSLGNPRAVAVDKLGNVYVIDVDSGTMHKVTPAGEDSLPGGPGVQNTIRNPFALAVDRNGTIYVAEADNNTVFRISSEGAVTLLAGGAAKAGEPGLTTPTSLAVDGAGNVFVADNGNAAIRKITPEGGVSTFAGKIGAAGEADGRGDAARFSLPRGITIDPDGNLYVADEGNSNIRKITPEGVVSTLAGAAGVPGNVDGSGPAAHFAAPRGLTVDAMGNVFVADTDNHTIRKVTPAGVVTTVAGKAGAVGKTDGVGSAARFSEPRGVAVDTAGNLYVADTGNAAIRMITPAGVVTTVIAPTKP